MAKLGPKPKDYFPGDKATHEWLDSQDKSTRNAYQHKWKLFIEFTGMTGDQILENRKQDTSFFWEKKTLAFKKWLKETKKKPDGEPYSDYSVRQGTVVVRSFFAHHHKDLQYRRKESQKLREAKRKTEDYKFSREDLKKMADVSDLTEKYVVVAGKSFGLRVGDFLKIERGDLEAYIDREPPISIGDLGTRKESVSAFPFIDSDAKPVIKLMLEKMDREGRTDPNERMLTYKHEIQVSQVLQRITNKAGINYGNKRVRFHCLRKFLTDRLSRFMSESKWKQIVGKTISEGAYVSSEELREDYARAMAETTFTKSVSEEEMELLAKKEALKMLAKMQGITEAEMKRIFRSKKVLTLKDEVKALEEITEETATNGGCQNGNCQRIVSEEELPNLLAEGWRVSAVLPSGRVVVSNEALPKRWRLIRFSSLCRDTNLSP